MDGRYAPKADSSRSPRNLARNCSFLNAAMFFLGPQNEPRRRSGRNTNATRFQQRYHFPLPQATLPARAGLALRITRQLQTRQHGTGLEALLMCKFSFSLCTALGTTRCD